MLELKVLGLPLQVISDTLKKEGYQKVSYITVKRYLSKIHFEDPSQAFKDELMRRQFADITQADLPLRLKYRGQLIASLLPQKMEHAGAMTFEIKGYGLGEKDPRPKK